MDIEEGQLWRRIGNGGLWKITRVVREADPFTPPGEPTEIVVEGVHSEKGTWMVRDFDKLHAYWSKFSSVQEWREVDAALRVESRVRRRR